MPKRTSVIPGATSFRETKCGQLDGAKPILGTKAVACWGEDHSCWVVFLKAKADVHQDTLRDFEPRCITPVVL